MRADVFYFLCCSRYKTDTTKQQTNISPLVMRIDVNITESLMGLHFTEKLKQHFKNNLLRNRDLVPDNDFYRMRGILLCCSLDHFPRMYDQQEFNVYHYFFYKDIKLRFLKKL